MTTQWKKLIQAHTHEVEVPDKLERIDLAKDSVGLPNIGDNRKRILVDIAHRFGGTPRIVSSENYIDDHLSKLVVYLGDGKRCKQGNYIVMDVDGFADIILLVEVLPGDNERGVAKFNYIKVDDIVDVSINRQVNRY